nr:uncharacterized protein CI109_004284 [Kwoniella shandongensis]KAA5527466.1 hypothetical protein CI109_004284 [Kwoniella shandongensis]
MPIFRRQTLSHPSPIAGAPNEQATRPQLPVSPPSSNSAVAPWEEESATPSNFSTLSEQRNLHQQNNGTSSGSAPSLASSDKLGPTSLSSPPTTSRTLAPLGGVIHSVAPTVMEPGSITPFASEALRKTSTSADNRRTSGGGGESSTTSPSKSTRSPSQKSVRKFSSPPTSPRQMASPTLIGGERKKYVPRTRNGSSSARMESSEEAAKRRAQIRAMEKEKGKEEPEPEDEDSDIDFDQELQPIAPNRDQRRRVSPLAKRLGEEPPFMLPHPSRNDNTSQTYPGVVIGSFAGGGDPTEALGFGSGMAWDGPMEDILDPSAPRAEGKKPRGSAGGQAEANIAPWLMDDEPQRKSPVQPSTPTPPGLEDGPPGRGAAATLREKDAQRKSSMQVLNHFASVPSLPKIRRQGTVDPIAEAATNPRTGSQISVVNIGVPTGSSSSAGSIRDGSRQSRNGSGDSLQTLSASQQRPPKGSPSADSHQPLPAQGLAKQNSIGPRVGRFGSTASQISGVGSSGSERKKGFLGGLLKRKTGASVSLNPLVNDFGATEPNRGSASGSASSRISSSASMGSLNPRSPTSAQTPTDRIASDSFGRAFRHGSQYVSEGAISPLQEISETPFHLDMNLDDMEGIVDPSKANVQPPGPGPTLPNRSDTGETVSSGPSESTTGSMFLQDALQHTSSYATSISAGGSNGSTGSGPNSPGQQQAGRAVISQAERQSGNPFVRSNPFQTSGGSAGSLDIKPYTPPSPHSLLPKHHLPSTTMPRRPSHLRNVKTGSTDSDNSEGLDGGSLQPIAPAWASNVNPSQTTMFNDPFSASSKVRSQGPDTDARFPSRAGAPTLSKTGSEEASDTRSSAGTGTGPMGTVSGSISDPVPGMASGSNAGSLAPPSAWAAPESWGVEGDEDDPEETDTSEEDDQDWVAEDDKSGVSKGGPFPKSPTSTPIDASPSGQRKAPPPFGFKSASNGVPKSARGSSGTRPGTANTRRGKTSNGRPSTSNRPGTGGRPGTSGSAHTTAVPQWMRIYRADGSYSLLNVPIHTTTAEVINILSGANEAPAGKKIMTSMKLYLRERGQDRMLLPSEKPAAIQHRRLLQAGYTDAEHIEDLGKDDLAILCRFIYQTPVLPIMDPEEESSYDSFEFIDVGGRDLQTIPIFLHLHAHNIIILNVSRNPMTDIPLDFIQACTTLKELRMQNMALKRVPMSIRASKSLARLDVSCNRIADLESVPLHEVETLVSLKVQNNKLISIPSYFAQMKALKYLNISNNKFETFPTVVCEMSNLVDLDVSFNNITELPSEMSDLKSLEKLALFSNELKQFPDSFSTLANLKQLDVRRNKITDLTVVYALPSLQDLQADYNNIVTLDAQIGGNVRQFSVPHNSVTRFTLAPLPNMAMVTYLLTNLDLSHGKISTLADEAFSGLVNLVHLNLNFNNFTRLPPTLERLTNLETFSCTDNMLNSIPKGFGKLQKLREINLHNNNLKGLSEDLWLCASLEIFNASSNLLEGFEPPPEDALETISSEPQRKSSTSSIASFGESYSVPAGNSTKKLYLGDNRLTEDIFHYVAMMPDIRVLNLSFNEIYEIPPYTIGKCDKLEALYLSGNKLTSLPSEDLEKLVNLKTLHLNGNKLQTLPSELGAIKTLQHLDVGSNVLKYNIANWPYDWNWNWNTALRYLNLSGNKRLEIKPTSAQDMSHASSFRKELSDFTALTQLRVLGLMDVTLRIPSLPDESDEKRVRTSFSDINKMAYGISDMLGSLDHLAMFDMVVPNFRGKDNECLFGMFGRSAAVMQAGKIPKHLQGIFAETLASHLDKLQPGEDAGQALRRTFLWTNRKTFEHFVTNTNRTKERKGSATSFDSIDDMFRNWAPSIGSVFRTGASGAVVYLVDKTLHVGNVGDTLVVLSRKGEAELLSKKHDPTDREETARIRKAEAWVSTKGFVNDDKDIDISRAFGYWHECLAVNADPEIRTRPLQESDEFVIIGNQALWKCCSYQTAVDIARTERDDPMMAAQKLRDFAICYGAEGSVMVMVVNISDLFVGRGGQRPRAGPGSGQPATADTAVDGEGYYGATAKRMPVRRRYEEVGDRTLNRLQQEIEPPIGQVAIVFTDIVNSTHLWETNPGMPTAIKMHHSFMRRQLRLDGGYEVKTEGDSFMVSFQSVTAALLWCFNCQIGLLTQEWPRELLEAHDGKVVYDSNGTIVARGLRVRMGVHWGAPECERDPITRRMDYYGPMVNRAARINASADGGQLMASQDVINEIAAVREYLETSDEDAVNELQGDMKREINELRRIGLFVKDMGERKLKGLEVPEKLHLLYPKTLSGRAEISNDLRAEVEVNDARKLAEEERVIDIEKVRQLANITLRLEAICSMKPDNVTSMGTGSPPTSPTSAHSFQKEVSSAVVRGKTKLGTPPIHLGPTIRQDMSDEELTVIIESLTGRVENAMSTLYIKHLGGFGSVLAALEQATKIDQKLLVHAMALMNGAFGGQ